jgi:hypothetical protein
MGLASNQESRDPPHVAPGDELEGIRRASDFSGASLRPDPYEGGRAVYLRVN